MSVSEWKGRGEGGPGVKKAENMRTRDSLSLAVDNENEGKTHVLCMYECSV